jgi:hypothetical protein
MGPRYNPTKILVEDINLAKVAAGKRPERQMFLNSVKFLLEPFPPKERVPVKEFIEGAREEVARRVGGNPRNRYCFTLARKGKEIVGASSVIYLDDAATVLIGFIRATADLGGAGMKTLGRKMLEFGQAAAKENGKILRSISGEVERPDVMNTFEARARLRLFQSLGAGVLGQGTSFEYCQPEKDGSRLPLAIAVYPLLKQTQMQQDEVKTLVRSIYAAIYGHLPKDVYKTALTRINDSIPDEPLRIVRQHKFSQKIVRHGKLSNLPRKNKPATSE